MHIGTSDVHLIGKLLDAMDDEAMKDAGFTRGERRRAEWIFEDVDAHLNERIGVEWNDEVIE